MATHLTPSGIQINRLPEVTLDFWIITFLAVALGEPAADYLAANMELGLTATSAIMTIVLIVILFQQLSKHKYVPWSYWSSVVLVSIVGTLVTDNLIDNLGVPIVTFTIVLFLALTATFIIWIATEGSLSIHKVFTTRREAFYWLAIMITSAVGVAVGDLVAENFDLGYYHTSILFGLIITSLTFGYWFMKLNPVLGFWLVYVFTRPLGAPFGDLLSQPRERGGLDLGTTITSVILLCMIALLVLYMTFTHDGEDAVVAKGA